MPLTWPACWQWCQQHAGLCCTLVPFCHGNTCEAFLSGLYRYPKNDKQKYNSRLISHHLIWKVGTKSRSYLDVNDVTLLVDAHVCWQGNGACEVTATLSSSTQAWVYKKIVVRGKSCEMTAPDGAHHVCGMACWTCTWFPSSCLLCSSWCLFTMKKKIIKFSY